jgi:hypothetical protein
MLTSQDYSAAASSPRDMFTRYRAEVESANREIAYKEY